MKHSLAIRTTRKEVEIFEWTSSLLAEEKYEVISVELNAAGPSHTLRVFIDFSEDHPKRGVGRIGVDDCASASQILSRNLDLTPDIERLMGPKYELEVSSPGLERPLKRENDFQKFQGERARIQLFRPLTEDEAHNAPYVSANPKQKNFLGLLEGLDEGSIRLKLLPEDQKTKKTKKRSRSEEKESPVVMIPLGLVTKAHLEPDLSDLLREGTNERKTEWQ